MQNALDRLREERTTIVVAHRLSTIMDADTIVVLHVSAAHCPLSPSSQLLLPRMPKYMILSNYWALQSQKSYTADQAPPTSLTVWPLPVKLRIVALALDLRAVLPACTFYSWCPHVADEHNIPDCHDAYAGTA